MQSNSVDLPLNAESEIAGTGDALPSSLTRFGAWNLYMSHALSTWNARTYEFSATLFTATAFPNTLFAQSMRGLCTTFAALCLSSSVGSWIDMAPSRLRTMLVTISANRAAVLLACLGWMFLVPGQNYTPSKPTDLLSGLSTHNLGLSKSKPGFPELNNLKLSKPWLFVIVIGLGICEKLSGIGNMISMEQEWVPILAARAAPEGDVPAYNLTHLNAVMRRIDLLCKLIAPVVISVIILSTSVWVGVVVVASTSTLSWGFEMWCARRVWKDNARLRQSKVFVVRTPTSQSLLQGVTSGILTACARQKSHMRSYFATDVWIPSLSLALLHLSALSYSATFITFLLNSGFSLLLITIARSASSIIEVSSTFVAPVSIEYLARPSTKMAPEGDDEQLLADNEQVSQDEQHLVGLARSGLWGITLQLGCLVPVVLAVSQIRPSSNSNSLNLISGMVVPTFSNGLDITAITMFAFLCVSRLGLWVFDITTQEITQTRVQPQRIASFAGTGMAFVSLFELTQWVLVAIISRPEQFIWVALISLGAVACSAGMYAYWVKKERGHLTHLGERRGLMMILRRRN